jgi:hypothetical protein
MVLNVLVYFLLGLVMLGQAQFISLHTRWEMQRTKIADRLASRWVRYSLAFIGLAALLAFLLPTGYTMGLLDVVGTIMYILGYIFSLFAFILLFIFSLLLAPCAMLFGTERLTRRQPILPPPQLPQQQPGGITPGWFEILRSLLFWAAALGMVFYVVRSYLRDHPEISQALTSLRPIRALRDFLIALWRRLLGLVEAASERIPRSLSLRRARLRPLEAPFRFFRLGALSPRERVLYYYLSILRRADRLGLPRQRAQTPYEYEGTLDPHLPQAQQEMTLLTQDFVEARYSHHVFDREQARRVRTHWQQVKAALQTLKRKLDTVTHHTGESL